MAIADPSLRGRDNRRLRNLLIYPKFQLPLIGINVALTALSLTVVWVSGREAFSNLEPMAAMSGMDAELFRKVWTHHYGQFNLSFLIVSALALLVSAGVTLYMSHKIAGPMVTLRRYFERIKEGEAPGELHFRDRDFLMDLPPLINDAMATLTPRETKKRKRA